MFRGLAAPLLDMCNSAGCDSSHIITSSVSYACHQVLTVATVSTSSLSHSSNVLHVVQYMQYMHTALHNEAILAQLDVDSAVYLWPVSPLVNRLEA